LDRLVVAHLPSALRFARRLSGDGEAAEELVQEALLRAVRRWAGFRGEAEFRTWLFRLIINVFRDRLRAAGPTLVAIDDEADTPDRAIDAPAAAAQSELEDLVAREVSCLPPRQREVLSLVVYEGFGTRQVGEILGISEANVYSTLSTARARLKARLAPHLDSREP
jgi:RNA polymerase sigma-70 factor (ECF subfamily)